jgi:hypothetical protein
VLGHGLTDPRTRQPAYVMIPETLRLEEDDTVGFRVYFFFETYSILSLSSCCRDVNSFEELETSIGGGSERPVQGVVRVS